MFELSLCHHIHLIWTWLKRHSLKWKLFYVSITIFSLKMAMEWFLNLWRSWRLSRTMMQLDTLFMLGTLRHNAKSVDGNECMNKVNCNMYLFEKNLLITSLLPTAKLLLSNQQPLQTWNPSQWDCRLSYERKHEFLWQCCWWRVGG